MPFNGGGTFTLPTAYNPVVSNTVILADWANATFNDVAGGLTNTITRDGQSIPTANLPMGGFRHTNVGAAVQTTNYATGGQVQDSSLRTLTSIAGGPNAYTANLVFGLTAFTANFLIFGLFNVANAAGGCTLSVNGSTALPLLRLDGSALQPNDITNTVPVSLMYSAGKWYVTTGPAGSGLPPPGTVYVPLTGGNAPPMSGALAVYITSSGGGGTATTWVQEWRNLGANTNGGRWSLSVDKLATKDRFYLNTLTDAGAFAAAPIMVQRNGSTPEFVQLNARAIIGNGADDGTTALQVTGNITNTGNMFVGGGLQVTTAGANITGGITLAGAMSATGNVSAARILTADGSSGAPAHSFSNELNTGFYRAAAGVLSLQVNGGFVESYFGAIAAAPSVNRAWYNAGISALDTGIGRNAPGVVEVNNGTLGTLRDLAARFVNPTQIGSSAFTISGGSGALTADWQNGMTQAIVMTGAVTLSFANFSGTFGKLFRLYLITTNAGAFTWPAGVVWPNGVTPNLVSGPRKEAIIAFMAWGTNFYGNAAVY